MQWISTSKAEIKGISLHWNPMQVRHLPEHSSFLMYSFFIYARKIKPQQPHILLIPNVAYMECDLNISNIFVW